MSNPELIEYAWSMHGHRHNAARSRRQYIRSGCLNVSQINARRREDCEIWLCCVHLVVCQGLRGWGQVCSSSGSVVRCAGLVTSPSRSSSPTPTPSPCPRALVCPWPRPRALTLTLALAADRPRQHQARRPSTHTQSVSAILSPFHRTSSFPALFTPSTRLRPPPEKNLPPVRKWA